MYPYYFAYEAPAIPDVHTLSLHDALPICFAWQQIRATLEKGPVLMQVPRAGFTPALACVQCRRSARCNACYGPLAATDASRAHCTWCGARAEDWRCPHCEHGRWRARSVGEIG